MQSYLLFGFVCAGVVALSQAGSQVLGGPYGPHAVAYPPVGAAAHGVVQAGVSVATAGCGVPCTAGRRVLYAGHPYYWYNNAFYFADGRPCPVGFPPVRPPVVQTQQVTQTQVVSSAAHVQPGVAPVHPYAAFGAYPGYGYGYGYPAQAAYAGYGAYPYAYGHPGYGSFYYNNPFLRFPFKNAKKDKKD